LMSTWRDWVTWPSSRKNDWHKNFRTSSKEFEKAENHYFRQTSLK
jgi:hypothetical protein